jgi:hypothetical protein
MADRLMSRSAHSEALFAAAQRHLPGGVDSWVRAFRADGSVPRADTARSAVASSSRTNGGFLPPVSGGTRGPGRGGRLGARSTEPERGARKHFCCGRTLREDALALHKDALSTGRDCNALGGMACYYPVCGDVAEADAWFLAARNVYRGVSPFPVAVLEFQCGRMWLAQGQLVRARTWLESAVRRLPAFVLAQGHLAAIDAAEASTPPRAVITSSGDTK